MSLQPSIQTGLPSVELSYQKIFPVPSHDCQFQAFAMHIARDSTASYFLFTLSFLSATSHVRRVDHVLIVLHKVEVQLPIILFN